MGKVLNTTPLRTRLPTRAEIGSTGDGYERVRIRDRSISNRTTAPVVEVPTIAVHLCLNGSDGEMSGLPFGAPYVSAGVVILAPRLGQAFAFK
jgi:hypothetical protein